MLKTLPSATDRASALIWEGPFRFRGGTPLHPVPDDLVFKAGGTLPNPGGVVPPKDRLALGHVIDMGGPNVSSFILGEVSCSPPSPREVGEVSGSCLGTEHCGSLPFMEATWTKKDFSTAFPDLEYLRDSRIGLWYPVVVTPGV